MKEDMSKGGYEGRDYHSTWNFILGGFSWICTEESLSSVVRRISTGSTGCWRFWARGAGYPYDILELGSCASWQGGTRFGQCLTQFSNEQQDKQRVSIRPRYVKLCICFMQFKEYDVL